jgi:hypothetical protein
MKLVREAGGVTTTVLDDAMQRAPAFLFESARGAREVRGTSYLSVEPPGPTAVRWQVRRGHCSRPRSRRHQRDRRPSDDGVDAYRDTGLAALATLAGGMLFARATTGTPLLEES